MSGKTDHELIYEAQAGDRAAFSMLVERHYKFMFRSAWQWLGGKQEAEDMAQEAAIKLAQNINSFRFESAFTTWLYRLTINTAKDYCKVKNRNNAREQPLFEDVEFVSPELSAEQQLMHKDVLQALAALPEQLSETVIIVCWQGLSHKEAGEIMECPEGTVSYRVHEARKKIAEKLELKGKEKRHG
jgi:RNA polymerase sigma-70 factor (ECF subfamily)